MVYPNQQHSLIAMFLFISWVSSLTEAKQYPTAQQNNFSHHKTRLRAGHSRKLEPTSTAAPTTAPTYVCSGDIPNDEVFDILMTVSDPCLMVVEGTPQNNAHLFVKADKDVILDASNKQAWIQRYVLAVLYYETLPRRMDAVNWISHATHECSWGPVTCVDNVVTELRIANFGLTGTIPDEFAALSSLTYVRMEKNALSGTIPCIMGTSLTSLQALHIDHNAITGTIPSALGELTSLQYCNFSNNQISGTLPTEIGSISSSLVLLDGSDNQLTGTLPTEIGGLTRLGHLYLNNNGFVGTLPKEWGSMIRMLNLEIENNALTGKIPKEWKGMPMVHSLYLEDNDLSEPMPKEVCNLYYLSQMRTDWCSSKNECCD